MSRVVLLLGGNRGSVEQTFSSVRGDLEREVGQIVDSSTTLRSEAWGFEADDFLNQAVVVESSLEPHALLDITQRIEQRWGRERVREQEEKSESGERYCSRAIDIDIIFYGEEVIQSQRLVVPHPLLEERKFVLEPLNQIMPHFVHPQTGLSVAEMLNRIEKQ